MPLTESYSPLPGLGYNLEALSNGLLLPTNQSRTLALKAPRSCLFTDIGPRRIEPERSTRRRI
jgi:hypothetical protein